MVQSVSEQLFFVKPTARDACVHDRSAAKNSFLLVLALVALTTTCSFGGVPLGRLPETVRPLRYDLSLTILPEQKRFSGDVRIEIQINKKCSEFWIHGKNLRVRSASLLLADGRAIPVRYVQRDAEEGVAQIVAPEMLEPQQVLLAIGYDAPFDDQLEGLYSVEEDSDHYAFTQFESIFARLCFPSFDEPSFRTPFDVTLVVAENNHAISNAQTIAETPLENGLKKVRFAQTPPLPTYLLAFAVGPFDVLKAPDIPASSVRGFTVPLRGVAARGKGEKLKYALARVPEFFQRLENYFGIAYPFSKLDVIAVPDFDYGAMENAGAITFDEYELLLDENAPVEQVRNFALTMTHELSHQWFGDLVTIRWWDDVWLNESFATWMESKIVQEWNPSYRSSLSGLEYAIVAMRTDSLQAAHALRMTVDNGSDAEAQFDSIAYAKGGAVLSMFESYLGKERFQKGIRHYLEKRRFTSATSEEFLTDLSEATDPDVRGAVETFLFRSGVPLVDVAVDCSGNRTLVTLNQSRYLPLGSTADPQRLWQIPVCLRYETGVDIRKRCVLLAQKQTEVELDGAGCPRWILPNAESAGYYRWNLAPQWYEKVEDAPLSLPEKLAVADSLQASFAGGRLSLSSALEALTPFASSEERAVASVPMGALQFTLDSLLSPETVPALRSYADERYKGTYERLGFDPKENDDDNARLLRSDVVAFLAFVARNPEVRREADRHARAFLGFGTDGKLHRDALDRNLIGVALGVGLQENGPAFLDALIDILKHSPDTALRDGILTALGSAIDPSLSPRILALTFDPVLRQGEADLPLFYQMRHPETRDIAWSWFRRNYDQIVRRLPASDLGYLPLVARRFCSETRANEVKAFFQPRLNRLPGAEEGLAESLESISLCAARARAQSAEARQFFSSSGSHR
jgi:alanyl aminopeptidase